MAILRKVIVSIQVGKGTKNGNKNNSKFRIFALRSKTEISVVDFDKEER